MLINAKVRAVVPNCVQASVSGLVSRGVRSVEISEEGHLLFTMTDGAVFDLGDATGPAGPQGSAGASFTYDMFTAEQLDALRGPKGDTGERGPVGDIGPAGPTGATGAAGPAGANGYTPVRGTDYWTAADIAEIKSYVDEAILGGAW